MTLAALGWRYWALGQQAAQLEEDIAAAQREEARLQEILRQVTEFETRKATLEARLALIDELRKGQNAPVHMIDQVSRGLPDMTWLTNVAQSGYTLTIQGRCLTLDVAVGLHRQPRGVALFHPTRRNRRERGGSRRR